MAKSRTSFKKGQTGNPNGAPKKENTYRELIKELGEADRIDLILESKQYNPATKKDEVIKKNINLKVSGKVKSIKEAEVAILHSKFLSGDAKFAQLAMDRAEGKPIQPLEHTGQMAVDYYFETLREVEDEEAKGSRKKN